ncbi:DUF1642 domain-containing protein [Lactococcus lactis]|uniref:DUF1642 domain-containing protein n=1 Tax=Lactococcus lactis TaxID=1358 RepID=UPI00285ECBCA|nr:DUF1642 domain-containing protein [Lactococcus lactis]MDR7696122.1 DUF1642 domain-containing protein [Lactococcus lactis]
MTKFEEELFNKVPCKFELTTEAEYKKTTLINHFKNWHSDDEFQELKEEYSNQADSLLLMLEEIGSLKSQLQQQSLPVIPKCVAEFIERYKDRRTIYGVFDKISKNRKTYPKLYEWVFEDENSQATFALAFITGKYEVEKSQLFYLKHIDMSKTNEHYDYYLSKNPKGNIGHSIIGKGKLPKLECILKLTQQEIDSMQTGSYELVPVEDGE